MEKPSSKGEVNKGKTGSQMPKGSEKKRKGCNFLLIPSHSNENGSIVQ